jgi:sporulation integral membrane protein YtvI
MRYAGTTIADRAVAQIPSVLSGFLSGVPDGALRFGTGLLASFMISARLPKLKSLVQKHVPQSFKDNYLPALLRTRKALGGWLKAQGILSSVTYGIVSLGLLILRVPYGFFWALFVTLVDAVPMLGTGIILLPWAMIRLLQSQPGQAVGLLLIFGAASLCRATLEPKLVGKQLGLDPLLTLVALYCGYRIWGFWGLLGAPVLTAAIKSFLYAPGQDS